MSNSLSAVHPELIVEWSDRNLPLTPDSVTFGSNKKVWWKYAGCVNGAQWFKDRGQWADHNYEPAPGTIIFFDWEGDGETDHTGIVQKCENGIVYTVEGNSGDACRQRQYAVGSSSIYGYGIPAY